MILIKKKPETSVSYPVVKCPRCSHTFYLANVQDYSDNFGCPDCGLAFKLIVEIKVRVEELKESVRNDSSKRVGKEGPVGYTGIFNTPTFIATDTTWVRDDDR